MSVIRVSMGVATWILRTNAKAILRAVATRRYFENSTFAKSFLKQNKKTPEIKR